MSFYYHGNGPNMEARPPTKNHASLPERLRVARLEQHNLRREIYRINSTDCFMWDFFLAGKSWALILSNLWKIQGLEISSEEFSIHQTCQLDRKPNNIIYIYIKAQSINSILFWKKRQVSSSPTIYNLSLGNSYLRAGDGDRVGAEAALQEMEWRQPPWGPRILT